MAGPAVHVSASRTNRSLVGAAPAKSRIQADPVLLFWRKFIDTALADAKRTYAGLPTDGAILARWWIEENKPKPGEYGWETSFNCCCGWLNLDAAEERKRLIAATERSLVASYKAHVMASVYLRRAAVLTCAMMRYGGKAIAIGRQYELPLVAEQDFEHVANIEHGDPVNVTKMLRLRPAA